jgi:hypothetical protein
MSSRLDLEAQRPRPSRIGVFDLSHFFSSAAGGSGAGAVFFEAEAWRGRSTAGSCR